MEDLGIYPVAGEKKEFVLKSSIWKITRQKGGFALREKMGEKEMGKKEQREGRKKGVFPAQRIFGR